MLNNMRPWEKPGKGKTFGCLACNQLSQIAVTGIDGLDPTFILTFAMLFLAAYVIVHARMPAIACKEGSTVDMHLFCTVHCIFSHWQSI